MNIVVVTKYESDISNFVRDASDWVMKNPVDKTLYRYSGVGANRNVRIGPYNIMFARRPEVLLGLRIDIVYYYGISIEASMVSRIESRMTPGGKIFIDLHCFMVEVFRRAENEVDLAKRRLLNSIYGIKAVNYPEDLIANLKETMKKANRPWELSDYNKANGIEIDCLNSGILRQFCLPTELCKPNVVACIKEETTMNCDIRSNIKDVIFSDRVTIILWKDGTKTMVRAGKHEYYDPEKGFAMAVCKKMFGNEGNYYEVFKKYVPVTHYIVDKKDAKKDIMITDQAVSDEVKNEIAGMINECQEKGKIWPGLTRKKWKDLVNKVAKCVTDKRKREEAEADCKKKKEGIRSGKYPWGMDMSKYMTPPEEDVNSSGKEE